jgi:CheY-like chemotaxis protein
MRAHKAIKRIRSEIKLNQLANIPIVALSAQEDSQIIKNALNAGANEYSILVSSCQTYSNEQAKRITHQILNYLIYLNPKHK